MRSYPDGLANIFLDTLISIYRRNRTARTLALIASPTAIVLLLMSSYGVFRTLIPVTTSVWFLSAAPILLALTLVPLSAALLSFAPERKTIQEKIDAAEAKVESQPEKIRPAWDLARITLEAYFARNLSQSNYIFWLSVGVMLVGFGIIAWSVTQAVGRPETMLPAIIAGVAGVITEFIGATFLFVYRSTIRESADYFRALERMTVVGMALTILDTMPDTAGPDDYKHSTKTRMIDTLVKHAYEGGAISRSLPSETSKKSKSD
jgi:hypothetical protein